MSDENIKNNEQLGLDDLDEVAGGYLFYAQDAYEVLDNSGNVVERFGFDPGDTPSIFEARKRAAEAARNRGLDDGSLPWEVVRMMRNQ